MGSRRRICWSLLPSELLLSIAECLETRSEILNFKLVCKTWGKFTPRSLLVSKNMLCPIFPHRFYALMPNLFDIRWNPKYYINHASALVTNCVIRVTPRVDPELSSPWIVLVKEFNPGKLLMHRAFLPCTVVSSSDLPSALDWSQCNVVELNRFHTLYQLEWSLLKKNKNLQPTVTSRVILVDEELNKIINNNKSTNKYNYNALVLYKNGRLGKVVVRDGKFVGIHHVTGFDWEVNKVVDMFDDFVKIKDIVYAIDRKGRLYCTRKQRDFDQISSALRNIVKEGVGTGCGRDGGKRLVESCGELYLIHRTREKQGVTFKTYCLNTREMKWEELVKGVGDDRILFVTHCSGFFVQAKDLPGWPGNCLVFPDGYCLFPNYNDIYGPDIGIFGWKSPLGDELALVVYDFGSDRGEFIDSYPGYSKVFWSPPAWLSSPPPFLRRCSEKDGRERLSQVSAYSRKLDKSICPAGCEGSKQVKDNGSLIHTQKLSLQGTSTQIGDKIVTEDARDYNLVSQCSS